MGEEARFGYPEEAPRAAKWLVEKEADTDSSSASRPNNYGMYDTRRIVILYWFSGGGLLPLKDGKRTNFPLRDTVFQRLGCASVASRS